MAKAFNDLSKGQFSRVMTIEKAVYMKSHLQLSTREWTDIRIIMAEYVRMPTKDHIRAYAMKITPPRVLKNNGVFFDFYSAVVLTLQRLPINVKTQIAAELDDGSVIFAKFAGGMDTSGGHRVYNSASSLKDGVTSTHMYFIGFTLLFLKSYDGSQKTLFENMLAASVDTERSLGIFPGEFVI